MAADGLEGGAGGVGLQLIIARDCPDFATMLQAHLRRPQDVAGGMERNTDSIERHGLAIGEGFNGGVVTEAGAEQALAGLRGQVLLRSGAGVIGMGVGDDGAVHGSPGVDVEVAGGAVDAILGYLNHDLT
jgi:hypothetical protein